MSVQCSSSAASVRWSTDAGDPAYGTTAMFDGAHDLMLEPVWPEVADLGWL